MLAPTFENGRLPKNGNPQIDTGYKMYFSETHANKFSLNLRPVVLVYDVNDRRVEATLKVHNQAFLDAYLGCYPDATFVFEMNSGDNKQSYHGTRCCGPPFGKVRCKEQLKATSDFNCCPPCWKAIPRLPRLTQ